MEMFQLALLTLVTHPVLTGWRRMSIEISARAYVRLCKVGIDLDWVPKSVSHDAKPGS